MLQRGWLDVQAARATVVLLAAAVLLSVLAARFETFPLDRPLTEWVNGRGDWFEPVADGIGHYNTGVGIGATLVAAVVLAWRRAWDALLLVPLAVVLRLGLSEVKEVVGRPRPVDLEVLVEVPETWAFPSGHVMTAAMAFGLWYVLAPELVPRPWVTPVRAAAVIVIGVVAVSRLWGGAHWASDTYGAVLWAAAALAALLAVRPALGRITRRSV